MWDGRSVAPARAVAKCQWGIAIGTGKLLHISRRQCWPGLFAAVHLYTAKANWESWYHPLNSCGRTLPISRARRMTALNSGSTISFAPTRLDQCIQHDWPVNFCSRRLKPNVMRAGPREAWLCKEVKIMDAVTLDTNLLLEFWKRQANDLLSKS